MLQRKQSRIIGQVLRWAYGTFALIYSTAVVAKLNAEFIETVTNISTRTGFNLNITSTYRPPTHPIEKIKEKPGDHSKGLAIDFSGVYIHDEIFLDHSKFQHHPKYHLFVTRVIDAGFMYINEGNHSHIAKTPKAESKLYMAVKGKNGLIYSLGRNPKRYFETVTYDHPDYQLAKKIISRFRK